MNASDQLSIDLAPTWGQVGLLFWRLAMSRETRALQAGKEEFARAFAMAEAMNELMPTFTEDQKSILAKTLATSLTSQGY